MLYLPSEMLDEGFEFEKNGFQLGEEEYLGYKVEALPDGWHLIGGSKFDYFIVDDKNRVRGKLENEEDDDTLQMFTRYDVGYRVKNLDEPFLLEVVALDVMNNDVLRAFGIYEMDETDSSVFEELVKEAVKFLDENFEGWRNPFAYWDGESFGGRFRFVPIYDRPRG